MNKLSALNVIFVSEHLPESWYLFIDKYRFFPSLVIPVVVRWFLIFRTVYSDKQLTQAKSHAYTCANTLNMALRLVAKQDFFSFLSHIFSVVGRILLLFIMKGSWFPPKSLSISVQILMSCPLKMFSLETL